MERWALGVFTSVDAGLGVSPEVARDLGVGTVQLHAPHAGSRTREKADELRRELEQNNLVVTVVFGGFEGESYESIPKVKETVGLVPKATRAARLQEMKEIAQFASLLGCDAVGLHLGFIPEETDSQDYEDIVAVTRDLLDDLATRGQRLHLETGQETAEGLLTFIEAVGRNNLFINFDPANLILYGMGDPMEALVRVGQYVRSVHVKDATASDQPGVTWGQEVLPGMGEVGMKRYLHTLAKIGYTGPLTIEREIPHDPAQQQADLAATLELLSDLKVKIKAAEL
jgi:sugar phosphate isomerase/epimerase